MNQTELDTLHRLRAAVTADQVLEIRNTGAWLQVSEDVFRSWEGDRRLNGGIYFGPVYKMGSDEIVTPFVLDAFGESNR